MSLIDAGEIVNVIIAILIADMSLDYIRIQYKRYKRRKKREMLEKIKIEKEKQVIKKDILQHPVKEQTAKRI